MSPAAEPRRLRRAPRRHRRDQRPGFAAELGDRQSRETEEGAPHVAVGESVTQDVGGDARRNGETDPAAAELVDADHLAGEIHQRSARVAGQDQRVVLDPLCQPAGRLAALELDVRRARNR